MYTTYTFGGILTGFLVGMCAWLFPPAESGALNQPSRAGVSVHPSVDTRPNIVLIVADDHGREAVGCYGNQRIRTPHIDQLAADGTRFSNAFCTTASCSPSRSVLLTGLHNHANGMYGLEHQVHHFSSFDTVRSLPVFARKNWLSNGPHWQIARSTGVSVSFSAGVKGGGVLMIQRRLDVVRWKWPGSVMIF